MIIPVVIIVPTPNNLIREVKLLFLFESLSMTSTFYNGQRHGIQHIASLAAAIFHSIALLFPLPPACHGN